MQLHRAFVAVMLIGLLGTACSVQPGEPSPNTIVPTHSASATPSPTAGPPVMLTAVPLTTPDLTGTNSTYGAPAYLETQPLTKDELHLESQDPQDEIDAIRTALTEAGLTDSGWLTDQWIVDTVQPMVDGIFGAPMMPIDSTVQLVISGGKFLILVRNGFGDIKCAADKATGALASQCTMLTIENQLDTQNFSSIPIPDSINAHVDVVNGSEMIFRYRVKGLDQDGHVASVHLQWYDRGSAKWRWSENALISAATVQGWDVAEIDGELGIVTDTAGTEHLWEGEEWLEAAPEIRRHQQYAGADGEIHSGWYIEDQYGMRITDDKNSVLFVPDGNGGWREARSADSSPEFPTVVANRHTGHVASSDGNIVLDIPISIG